MEINHPFPGKDKGGRIRAEVQLPAQLKMAGRVGEAPCAACHLRGFMVVEYPRRFRRTQVPLESAVDFVAVGRKPVKGAGVRNIIFTKIRVGFARARGEFRGSSERSQVVCVSEVDHVY